MFTYQILKKVSRQQQWRELLMPDEPFHFPFLLHKIHFPPNHLSKAFWSYNCHNCVSLLDDFILSETILLYNFRNQRNSIIIFCQSEINVLNGGGQTKHIPLILRLQIILSKHDQQRKRNYYVMNDVIQWDISRW